MKHISGKRQKIATIIITIFGLSLLISSCIHTGSVKDQITSTSPNTVTCTTTNTLIPTSIVRTPANTLMPTSTVHIPTKTPMVIISPSYEVTESPQENELQQYHGNGILVFTDLSGIYKLDLETRNLFTIQKKDNRIFSNVNVFEDTVLYLKTGDQSIWDEAGENNIYQINLDGSNEKRITDNGFFEYDLTSSSDKNLFAFSTNKSSGKDQFNISISRILCHRSDQRYRNDNFHHL